MARRKEIPIVEFRCRECALSRDWQRNSNYGQPILCRCDYFKDGKFLHFLSDRSCKHFVKRDNQ